MLLTDEDDLKPADFDLTMAQATIKDVDFDLTMA